jgi:hypothetical protein
VNRPGTSNYSNGTSDTIPHLNRHSRYLHRFKLKILVFARDILSMSFTQQPNQNKIWNPSPVYHTIIMPSSSHPTLSPPFQSVQVAVRDNKTAKSHCPVASADVGRKMQKSKMIRRDASHVSQKKIKSDKAHALNQVVSARPSLGTLRKPRPRRIWYPSSRLLVLVVLCCEFGLLVLRSSFSVRQDLEPGFTLVPIPRS